ncbi:hypothetical protein GOP47_0004373 [Adiantum capillus-veneris]|uniref:Transcriptional regulatory protein n=1 Tax=Adiantum capillus-veneris TaxID=13818 RepID=A0A9D4ZQA6_ADICA|nr:hypothetical protein GOP47_0004373 [Adiantum capillus-veneris]
MGPIKCTSSVYGRYMTAFDSLANVRSLLFTGPNTLLEFPNSIFIWKSCIKHRTLVTLRTSHKLDAAGSSSYDRICLNSKPLLSSTYGPSSLVLRTRKLWTTVPVQMGRRSSKIAMRKGAQDAKKAKLYGRIGKEIVSAVRRGGSPNPVANSALAALLQYAKDFDIPKDIIERNIKKASEKGQQDFEPMIYEAYGFGGIGILIEVLTDNSNRAAANVREVVKKSGCKMADAGSVQFNFKKAGVVNVKADKVDADSLLAAAMDAGAEDVIEPTYYEDEDPQDASDKYYKVMTPLEQYSAVSKRLQGAGIPVVMESSGLEYIPNAILEPDDEAIELNKALMERLLELDDVDAVYSNQA